MGVGLIDDIPGDRRLEEEKKKKELRQAQHRMLQLAALRQREARRLSSVERALLSALALGRAGRTAMQTVPASVLPALEQQAQEDAQDRTRRRHEEQQQSSIKVSLKLRESNEKSQAHAQQRARHMLDALLAKAQSQSRQTAMAVAKRNQAQEQKDGESLQATQKDAAGRRQHQQQLTKIHEKGTRLRRQVDQRKQEAGHQQESRQKADAQAQAQVIEESVQRQTRDRQHKEAQDPIKLAAQAEAGTSRPSDQDALRQRNPREAENPGLQGNAAQAEQDLHKQRSRDAPNPTWLKRLLGEDIRKLRQPDLDRLQEQIRAAQQVASRAYALARRGPHQPGFAPITESMKQARQNDGPLGSLPTSRTLQRALDQVRTQAGQSPALAPLTCELKDLLQLIRRAERDWRNRQEGTAGEGIDKPKDDDASWMRRLDQEAQALSGVLGPDIQSKALQSLLGPDVTRLERLIEGGAPSARREAQQLRVERRALQLERWALKEHSAKLADELREWLNRERHRVEQAESPQPSSLANGNPSQHGVADNAYLKQVQSL